MRFSTITALSFSGLAFGQIHDSLQARPREILPRQAPPPGPTPKGPSGPGGPGGPGAGGPPRCAYQPTPEEMAMMQAEPVYPPDIQQAVMATATEPPPLCGPAPVTGALAATATSVYSQLLRWRDTNSAPLLAMMSKIDAACPGQHAVEDIQALMACPAAAGPTAAPGGGSGGGSGGGANGGAGGASGGAGGASGGSGAGAGAGAGGPGAGVGSGAGSGAGAGGAGGASGASPTTTGGSTGKTPKADTGTTGNSPSVPATKSSSGAGSMNTAMAAGGLIAWAIGAVIAL